MDLSKLRSRRNILGLAIAGALTRVVPVRAAQSTAGCDISFTYGLLTIGGDNCQLLSPPGMDGANIALPIQMVDDRGSGGNATTSSGGTTSSQGSGVAGATTTTTSTSSSSTTSPQAERQARLKKHRDKKRRKRGRKTDQKQTQKGRKRTRRQARIDALITCDDFATQKAAIEWLAQNPGDAAALDPNGDGLPCVELPRVSCSQFTDAKDARQWLRFYGFAVDASEPFGLYDGVEICPAKG